MRLPSLSPSATPRPRNTELYEQTGDEIMLDDVEPITI